MANRIPLVVDILDSNKIKELPVGDNLDLGGAGVTNAGTINATDVRINNVSFNNPFSGDYNDLTNKPQIPEVPSALSAFANDVGYLSTVVTDDVVELGGATNKWHTDSRVDARIQAAQLQSLNNVTATTAADDGKVLYYDHASGTFKYTATTTEVDTIDTVLSRGNTTTRDIKTTGKVYFANKFDTEEDLFAVSPSIYHGMFAHVHATGKAYFAHHDGWFALVKEGDGLTAIQVAADDSTIRTVSTGESIKFAGGTGISTASDAEGNITFNVGNIGDLVDVGVAGATNGQVLTFDSGAGTWGPGSVASPNNIDDLTDVDTTTITPVNDYVLSFKSATAKWEPRILNNVDAATVTTVADSTAAAQFVTFVGTGDSNGQDLRTDASITYNPNTNVLSATSISATTFNATNLNITGSISNGINEVTFATDLKLGSANEVRWYDTNNTNYMGFKAPTDVTTTKTFTWPDGDGTNGQVLTTDGAETLSWVSAASGDPNEDSFKTIEVSGQSDVVADSTTDTLTLVAGANMTITTSGDEITFVASGGGGGGTPGGADTQVQFNDASSFGGDAGLLYNKTTDTLTGVNIVATKVTADEVVSSGAGIPTITSASNLILDAANAVVIQKAPLRVGSFDNDGIAGIVGQGGDVIYNSSAKQLVFSDGTSWIPTSDNFTFSVGADDSTLRPISKDESIKFIGGTGITTASDAEGNITFTGSSGGASSIDGLTDAISGAANFTNSIKLGDATTGTLNAAEKNTIVGFEAGGSLTDADSNVLIGFQAGKNLDAGSSNTILGSYTATAGETGVVVVAAGTSERLRISATGLLRIAGGSDVDLGGTDGYVLRYRDSDGKWLGQLPGLSYSVINFGTTAFRWTGPGVPSSADNPTMTLYKGFSYTIINEASTNHPIEIRVSAGGSAYTTGVSGSTSGTQLFTVPMDAPSTLVYQCTLHSAMVGDIVIA